MSYDFEKRSRDSAIFFDLDVCPSKTKQEFRASCNINNILKKYTRSGVNPFVLTANARFSDLSNLPDFQDAMDIVAAGNEYFDSLPASIRNRFDNDPAQLLSFISDVNNREEAISLGFIEKSVQILDEKSKIPATPVVSGEAASTP